MSDFFGIAGNMEAAGSAIAVFRRSSASSLDIATFGVAKAKLYVFSSAPFTFASYVRWLFSPLHFSIPSSLCFSLNHSR